MKMHAHLIALTVASIIFFLPLQPGLTATNNTSSSKSLNDLDLPAALSDDDSFGDLPFEQLRQALREEVEYGPKKGISPRSTKRYNFLIR